GIARKVDQDVRAEIVDLPRGRLVVDGAKIDKSIECRLQPHPQLAAVVGCDGICDELEGRPIMAFDKINDEMRQRMGVVIGAEIAEANFPLRGSARMTE